MSMCGESPSDFTNSQLIKRAFLSAIFLTGRASRIYSHFVSPGNFPGRSTLPNAPAFHPDRSFA